MSDLGSNEIESCCVEAFRENTNVAPHLFDTTLLCCDLSYDTGELVNSKLHACEFSFRGGRFVRQNATTLVESLHFRRHIRQLLKASLVIETIEAKRLAQPIQMLHDSMKAFAELTAARRARRVGTEADHSLALLFHFGPLSSQIRELRLRILSVANPFGALCLERALRFLDFHALLLEVHRHFLFLGRSFLD